MTQSDQTAVTTEPALDLEMIELQDRAEMLNMRFHPNIGKETLRKKLIAFAAEKAKKAEAASIQQAVIATDPIPRVAPAPIQLSQKQIRMNKVKAANKLVRCRVTCMDPGRKDWEGDYFTVSNSVIPTIKKYVSFVADAWYVPQMILDQLLEKECTVFKTVKGPRGDKMRKGFQQPAYNIVMLPPLNAEEMTTLATQQAMAGNIG